MKYADITLPNIEKAFNKFNELYFANSLPTPIFCIKTNHRALGSCSVQKKPNQETPTITITISNFYLVPDKDFEDTLIHEMIHLKQYITFGRMSHTTTFKQMAEAINKESNGRYNITRCSSRKGYELSNEAKIRMERKKLRQEKKQILSVKW